MQALPRILIALAAAAAAACAQRLTWYEKLLLVEMPRTVSGTVVDQSGRPLAGAHIDHSDVEPQEQLFTDDRGRFEIRTRAPAVVIRKRGYDGRLLRLGAARLRVTLERSTRSLPACSDACLSLKNSSSAFCFPRVSGVSTGEAGHYEDIFVRAFTVISPARITELLHGAGPGWTLGIPYTGDVWEAQQYSETDFSTPDSDIIDARGVAPDGRHWRYLGRYGESAAYYEANSSAAALLDKVLDGVCLSAP
jgi:hypothetical protein